MRKIATFMLLVVILQSQVCADPQRQALNWLWSNPFRANVNAIELATVEGQRLIYAGLANDTIVGLDSRGKRIYEFVLGNASQIGSIYSMKAADVDSDGSDELILGLGGAKEVRTYTVNDFTTSEGSMSVETKDKVLFRVTRNHGGVYVIKADGRVLWRYLTDDSTRAVNYVELPQGGGYIVAGIGDQSIYVYNERSDEPITEKVCYTEPIDKEETGYTTLKDCQTKACLGIRGCTYEWDNNWIDPARKKLGTEERCYRTYEKTICGTNLNGEKLGWRFVEYKSQNGSVAFVDRAGNFLKSYPIIATDKDGHPIEDADNIVRDIEVHDINNDSEQEVIVGANNGEFSVLNTTNMSNIGLSWKGKIGYYLQSMSSGDIKWQYATQVQRLRAGDINQDGFKEVIAGTSEGWIVVYDSAGSVLWRQRVDDAITGLAVADIDGTGIMDVIATSRDGRIYVYNPAGTQKWSYNNREPVYGIKVTDFGGNELEDFIVQTTGNVTRYETDELYVKRIRADNAYNTAYDNFMSGDYTKASIFVDRSREIYRSMGDQDGMSRCRMLQTRIENEFKLAEKAKADRHYNQALKYYAMSELDSAKRSAIEAQKVYLSLGDDEGDMKVQNLLATIDDDGVQRKKIAADGKYNKAYSLMTFGNYSGALDLIEEASRIYAEVKYFNETVKCDRLVINIADRHYRMALSAYDSGNFNETITYAMAASDLYLRGKSLNASYYAIDLAKKANDSMWSKPEPSDTSDYTPYLIAGILVLLAIIVYLRMQGPKTPQKRKEKGQPTDEELETLERE
jgi:tetratricopeptide (TPR) repeat protein